MNEYLVVVVVHPAGNRVTRKSNLLFPRQVQRGHESASPRTTG